MKKKTYKVEAMELVKHIVVVQADTEDEAVDLAVLRFDTGETSQQVISFETSSFEELIPDEDNPLDLNFYLNRERTH